MSGGRCRFDCERAVWVGRHRVDPEKVWTEIARGTARHLCEEKVSHTSWYEGVSRRMSCETWVPGDRRIYVHSENMMNEMTGFQACGRPEHTHVSYAKEDVRLGGVKEACCSVSSVTLPGCGFGV